MRTLFFFCFFFLFSKEKRSVTPCEIGWLLWQVTPQSPAVTVQHKARPSGALKGSLIHKLANAVSNKVDRLHKQHLKEPTLQIQARATTGVGKPQADSECNERIPPDGFSSAALEAALHVGTPPPPNGGSPRTERSPLPCGHLPTPWGVTPFRGGLFTACKQAALRG